MGFFDKAKKRKALQEKFKADTDKAYESTFKKKLVADARKKAARDAMTPMERFRSAQAAVKKFKKRSSKFEF